MRKSIHVILLLFMSITLCGQITDLIPLASGTLNEFRPLYNPQGDVVNYIALYYQGRVSKEEFKFHYVIFDDNLNPKANGDFTWPKGVFKMNAYLNRRDQVVISPSYYRSKKVAYVSKRIDLKTNKLIHGDPVRINSEGQFEEIPSGMKGKDYQKMMAKESKKLGYELDWSYIALEDGNYVAYTYEKRKGKLMNPMLRYYDNDYKLLWEKRMQPITVQSPNMAPSWAHVDTDRVWIQFFDGITQNPRLGNRLGYSCYDLSSGEPCTDGQWMFPERGRIGYYAQYLSRERIDDMYTVIGTLKDVPDQLKRKGFFRVRYDAATGKTDHAELLYTDLGRYIEFRGAGEYAKLKDGGATLIPKESYALKDGSSVIILEEFKPETNKIIYATRAYSGSFYLVLTNPDFSIKEVVKIEKDKNKNTYSTYGFGQRINEERDIVFFFIDRKKNPKTNRKETYLTMNTVVDGKVGHSELSISSEDFTIFPWPAKDGYILLQEFNTNKDYNQVRLERINY